MKLSASIEIDYAHALPNHYDKLGADTCDGSGIAMYDHMLEKLAVDVEKANGEIDLFN